MLNYGWVCPKCGRVYAPNQEMCLYCGGGSISSPVTPPKKIQDGISWTNGYCNDLGSAHAISDWTVTSSCGETISADKVSNSTVEINGVELNTIINNKENDIYEAN